MIKCSKK